VFSPRASALRLTRVLAWGVTNREDVVGELLGAFVSSEGKKMKNHKRLQIIGKAILAIPLIVGCAARTPTPIPTPTPPPVMGWGDVTVNTLCLEVEQTYPEIDHKSPEPIDTHITELLTLMGFRVIGLGEGLCDARLSIVLTGEALGANYLGAGYSGYCFTGAYYDGQITLASEGRTSLVVPLFAVEEPAKSVFGCDKSKDPQNAPFADVWTKAVIDGLISVWGPQVLVNGLGVRGDFHFANEYLRPHLNRLLSKMGEDAIPLLVEGLNHSDPVIRRDAARKLAQDSGPEGREALASVEPEVVDAVVQPLIENLEAFLERGFPGDDISDTLEVITGQDFGEDASLWWDWWEERQ